MGQSYCWTPEHDFFLHQRPWRPRQIWATALDGCISRLTIAARPAFAQGYGMADVPGRRSRTPAFAEAPARHAAPLRNRRAACFAVHREMRPPIGPPSPWLDTPRGAGLTPFSAMNLTLQALRLI